MKMICLDNYVVNRIIYLALLTYQSTYVGINLLADTYSIMFVLYHSFEVSHAGGHAHEGHTGRAAAGCMLNLCLIGQ